MKESRIDQLNMSAHWRRRLKPLVQALRRPATNRSTVKEQVTDVAVTRPWSTSLKASYDRSKHEVQDLGGQSKLKGLNSLGV